MDDIAFKTATELAAMIQAKEVGSAELLDGYLERVRRFNPKLNAIIAMDEAGARQRAEAADAALAKGEVWGPLHGVPMTIKESYDVAGMPSTWGNPPLKDNVPSEDALSVQRLKAAGVVLFGKTNVPLNLADFQSYNDIYGVTNNPWNVERVPGGSSGGSAAALAAGMTGFESGSDIGGSIRNPAHFCGVFGHKPTWGLLPPRGHALPGVKSQSDLSVIGPLGRGANDLALGVAAMAGPDEIMAAGYELRLRAPRQTQLGQCRVACWTTHDMAPVTQEVQGRVSAVAAAITSAGGQVDFDAQPADFDANAAFGTYQTLLQAVMMSRQPDKVYHALQEEARALEADDASPRAVTLRRQTATFRDYSAANEARTRLRWKWHEFFQRYDALVAPIMATPAFRHDHRPFGQRTLMVDNAERPYFEQVFWAGLAICSYLPATVIPTGPSTEGLPIGVQIIGPEYGDLETIGLAKLLEAEGFAFTPPPGY